MVTRYTVVSKYAVVEALLISEKELAGLMETTDLFRSPKNVARLIFATKSEDGEERAPLGINEIRNEVWPKNRD